MEPVDLDGDGENGEVGSAQRGHAPVEVVGNVAPEGERHHLPGCVHTGVGAPGADGGHGRPQHRRQSPVHFPLHGAQALLPREAVEVGAVVGDDQLVERQTSSRMAMGAPSP